MIGLLGPSGALTCLSKSEVELLEGRDGLFALALINLELKLSRGV
jgi:hypothetical protein